MVILLLS